MVHNSDRGRGSPGCTGGSCLHRGMLHRGQSSLTSHLCAAPVHHSLTAVQVTNCYKTPKHKVWPVRACTTISLQIIFLNTEHVSEKGNARKWHKPARNCWWKNLKHFVEPVTPGIQEYSFSCGSHRLKCIECKTTHTLKCIKHIDSSQHTLASMHLALKTQFCNGFTGSLDCKHIWRNGSNTSVCKHMVIFHWKCKRMTTADFSATISS